MGEPVGHPAGDRDSARSRIAVLTAGGPLAWMTVDALRRRFGDVSVLVEAGEPRSVFLRRRLKRLGVVEVAGQLAFAVVQKLVDRASAARRRAIVAASGLSSDPPSGVEIVDIGSVNSEACRAALRRIGPRVVVVHGTRIIAGETLAAVAAPFINIHAGINPAYRGQHGGYWALARGDAAHAGVTVHLIDRGVDTGAVLYQAAMAPTPADNITTYQFLQTAAGAPLVVRAVEDALAGRMAPVAIDLASRQWYHPTLWGYLATGLRRGVW